MTDSTNQESTKRKLAAIMFTDIEGFTALSAHDEEKALELIDKQRHILKPIVEAHHGSWLKEMGDGLLLSFPSSKLAVNCAIEIQETLREVDDLNLRIGIHQGDILEKGGDVFGDDVNIASRIEPFAAAGGIAISDKVHRDISSSPELTTKYVGLPRLKGVKQEVKVYCIVSHGLSETRPSDISAKLEKKPASWFYWMLPALVVLAAAVVVVFPRRQEVPSVGILYIENLGTEEDEFWARGITEDVIIELASAGLVRVAPMKEILEFAHSNLPLAEIAKHLRVEYVLTGSIYKREDGFDLRAQLIEAHSGKSIYANKWSEPLKRASTITGTLAENIAESLGVTPTIEMGTTSIASPEAYELYLRGKYAYENRRNADDTRRARDFLKKAIQINSHLIRARLELGRSYYEAGDYDSALAVYQNCLAECEKHGDRWGIGTSLLRIGATLHEKDEDEKAQEFYERAIQMQKAVGDKKAMGNSLNNMGILLAGQGDYDRALDYHKRALELRHELDDKRAIASSLDNIGHIYLIKGDYDRALEYNERSLEVSWELGDRKGVGNSITYVGHTYLLKGEYGRALDQYKQAFEIRREIGDRSGEAVSLHTMGEAEFLTGNYREATAHFESASEIWSELGDDKGNLWTLSWWALTQLRLGKSREARVKSEQADNILMVTDPHDEDIVIVNWNLWQLFSTLGDSARAERYLEIAYGEVMRQAGSIKAEKDRKSFLTKIRENREVVDAWENLHKLTGLEPQERTVLKEGRPRLRNEAVVPAG